MARAAKTSRKVLFRLTDDYATESAVFKTGADGKLTIYDEKKKQTRAIRHCRNQKSIFIDEQDEFATVSPLIIESMQIALDPDRDKSTVAFLRANPYNVENGGGWFYEVKPEQEAANAVKREETVAQIKVAVMSALNKKDGEDKLYAELAVLRGHLDGLYELSVEELKEELYSYIDENPGLFTDSKGNVTIFDDESVVRKFHILNAISEGVLEIGSDNRTVRWADGGDIRKSPLGADVIDDFADFLLTEEGLLVMEGIVKKMK